MKTHNTTVLVVNDKKGLQEFIDFPHDLYAHDPNYVPELYLGQKDLLWKKAGHPFYNHSDAQLFLAKDNGKVVGRIAAIANTNHIAFTKKSEGFFGFFDSINDKEVAHLLLQNATQWLKDKSIENIIGPINLTTNDTCGLLVEGFDVPPSVMMPYNKPYYEELILSYGLKKRTDLLAYDVVNDGNQSKALGLMDRIISRLQNKGIVIRSINTKDFKNEVTKIREVYNTAWDKNLGFVPMTEEEFDFTAKELKMILDPKFCIIAEKDNKIVGFALGIPNINEIQKNIHRGRLFPTGIFKLLFGKKNVTSLRVLMLGVLEEYRKMGIEACLYGQIIRNAVGTKITKAECSWMLENNYMMNHAIEQINGKLTKRYRIFEKEI